MHPIQPRHFDAGSLTAKGRSTDTSCSKASAVENASIPGLTESSLLCVLMQRVLSACGHASSLRGEASLSETAACRRARPNQKQRVESVTGGGRPRRTTTSSRKTVVLSHFLQLCSGQQTETWDLHMHPAERPHKHHTRDPPRAAPLAAVFVDAARQLSSTQPRSPASPNSSRDFECGRPGVG